MAVEGEGGEKQFEDEMQAWRDNGHIHDDNDDGSCGHSWSLGGIDRIASTRGDEAYQPVEPPNVACTYNTWADHPRLVTPTVILFENTPWGTWGHGRLLVMVVEGGHRDETPGGKIKASQQEI